MQPEVFKKFVDDVYRHALLIILWGWGEPFICPSVYEMIEYAHRKGVRLVSSTNGHVFVRPEHAEGVVRSGLDALIVSLSGTTQEAYARFRGGELETALAGVREIVAQKRSQRSRTPHVQLSFIVTDYSESQIPRLTELARSLGVDGLSLKKMNTASVKPVPGRIDDALPSDVRYRRFQYGDDGVTRQRVKRNPCKALWHNPTLRWDGTINPCVYDFDGGHVLGDVKAETFRQIWSGERYRTMRRQFRRDWERIDICNQCTYAYAGGNYTDIVADTWLFNGEPV
jgi:radical SAM protein with 4Fe4S-binding SPASM domain